jgi:hypothetical protein
MIEERTTEVVNFFGRKYFSKNKYARIRLPNFRNGHAIAEAVSCRLPTAAARVRARVWQVGFVVDEVTSVAGSLQVLRFPLLKSFIPQTSSSSLSSSQSPEAVSRGLETS